MGVRYIFPFFVFFISCAAQLENVFSNEGKVDVKSFETCPVAGDGKAMKAEPKLVQSGSDKSFNINFEINFEVDDLFSYTMEIEKFDGKSYAPFMNLEGEFCPAADTYVKTIWTKMRQQMDPPLPVGECNVPPNKYTLQDFQVSQDEYKVPPGMNGQFKIVGKGYKEDGTEVACFLMEATVE